MELRELTQEEKNEFEKIRVPEYDNSYRLLLAMIAIDLMGCEVVNKRFEYEDFIAYIDDGKYHEGDGFILQNIIETWIIKLAQKNGISIDKKVEKDIDSLVVCFIYTVCGISPGISNKKFKEMVMLYNHMDEKLQKEKNEYLCDNPEENYRFIVTCLEYMGFKRIPSDFDGIIDARGIGCNDILI